MWLGFSFDEQRRATGKAHRNWLTPSYPLIDLRMNREWCLRIIREAGLPEPPKSRCWCCPHQNAKEWREVAANPEEWAKAVQLDSDIREADERGGLFLHKDRKPLALVDLGTEDDDTPPLFRACQDTGCWT